MSLIFDTIVVSDKFILVSAQIEIYNISTRNSLYGFTCICICKKKKKRSNKYHVSEVDKNLRVRIKNMQLHSLNCLKGDHSQRNKGAFHEPVLALISPLVTIQCYKQLTRIRPILM